MLLSTASLKLFCFLSCLLKIFMGPGAVLSKCLCTFEVFAMYLLQNPTF